jgi:hypothetical protein
MTTVVGKFKGLFFWRKPFDLCILFEGLGSVTTILEMPVWPGNRKHTLPRATKYPTFKISELACEDTVRFRELEKTK